MKNYENRHFFIVSTIVLVILSPLIIWLLPYILQRILYDGGSAWIIRTPGITYSYFAIAWLVLVVGSVTSYFLYRMKIGICIVCIIISTILMFFGLKPITALSTSGMIYIDAPFNEERQYTWEDVDKVYLIIDEETNERSLEFHYKDNEVITLDKKINIESLTVQLMELKKSYGFSFTTKE